MSERIIIGLLGLLVFEAGFLCMALNYEFINILIFFCVGGWVGASWMLALLGKKGDC